MKNLINHWVTRYYHEKFWNRYMKCQNNQVGTLKRMFYIYYIKRVSSLHCCDLMVTMSKNRNFGAYFQSLPYLPHGLNGIVISDQARIGNGVTILQQVTIGVKYMGGKAPIIGADVFIGAGAKILGEITIGNHVKIGANAVVLADVPDGATVVGNPAKIIKRGEKK